MQLSERIARRRLNSMPETLVADWEKLDPSSHLNEPVGRGSVLERTLDSMEPLFDGDRPSNIVVWGPKGIGKSAIVISLLSKLTAEFTESRSKLYTATRSGSARDSPRFAYVDTRRASSRYKLYSRILEYLTGESVPERGFGTGDLETRIRSELAGSAGAVVAVDHVDETGVLDDESLVSALSTFENVSWITIGRTRPTATNLLAGAANIEVPTYRDHELIDLLTVRANKGLTTGITHAQARTITEWADGDAHDALAVLFTAALVASDAGRNTLQTGDIEAAIEQTPSTSASIGRVLSLRETKQDVLDALLELDGDHRKTIETTAEAIAVNSSLTQTTVRRYLYELANEGFLQRVEAESIPDGGGRKPSQLIPCFPAPVYRKLRSLE